MPTLIFAILIVEYNAPWGSMGVEVKGVVTYAVAPNRQRAFAGAVDVSDIRLLCSVYSYCLDG